MEYNLKREWRYQFTAERWSRFLHTRLWLALPCMAAITFCVVILIGWMGNMEPSLLLESGAKEALITLVGALFGILIATAQSPEEMVREAEAERYEAEALYHSTSRGKALAMVLFLGAIAVAILAVPALIAEQADSPEGVIKIVGSVTAGVAVVAMQIIYKVTNKR
ncbi:MAG: hypothetical protein E7137_02520 [Rikenellaceae bacterium]|nr:hypothetical protein [Rikenellaceae bacterium]